MSLDPAPSSTNPRHPLRPGRRVTAALLAVTCFFIYNVNLRSVSSGDNLPARYLPFLILRHRTLSLDPMHAAVADGNSDPYWILQRTSSSPRLSMYPVTVPVLLTPLYIPAVAYLSWKGWEPGRVDLVARVMEKLCASLIASLSVAVMFLLLSRRVSPGLALLLAIAYALGTNTWAISSQALWQHGLSQLCLASCLLLLTGKCTRPRSFAAALLCGLAVASRPPVIFFAVAMAAYGWRWSAGERRFALAGIGLPALLLLAYNFAFLGSILGGYSSTVGATGGPDHFRFSLVAGVAGLLFSPGRGLFVFSPFLGFLLLLVAPRRRRGLSSLDALLLGAVIMQVLFFAKLDWRGGASWGPRWLTDALPLLVWVLAPVVQELSWSGLAAFCAAVLFSIGVQVVGAFWYCGASDAAVTAGKFSRSAVWRPKSMPILRELDHPPAPRDLLLRTHGAIDSARVGLRDLEEVQAGATLDVEGWCLAGGSTPLVAYLILSPVQPGRLPFTRQVSTERFFDRPDVSRALGFYARAGWRMEFPTAHLTPGEYRISLKVLAEAHGALRQVAHRRLRVLPPEPERSLEDYRRIARKRLRGHQAAAGYWPTAHTTGTSFVRPLPEMNTFLTAVITDLLSPLATDGGLQDSCDRARRHLAAQIEGDGLVRYHGRPELIPPSMGYPITPDADDTALAWRVAGMPATPLLSRALAVLAQYRTPEGLYRTWLSPKERYVAIDPGADPNPADACIQMHVLMFLDLYDRAAAATLFAALRRAIADESLWVYYTHAPLIPLLRSAELGARSYPLSIPPARRRTELRGQKPWLRACELIASSIVREDPSPVEIRSLLETLAANDFAVLDTDPPLLYHNDPSARVRRFYWSEDFGYALWLRLYAAAFSK